MDGWMDGWIDQLTTQPPNQPTKEVSSRALLYFHAKGNMDRVVRGIRARSNLPSLPTYLYFPHFERGDLKNKVKRHLATPDVDSKDVRIYMNPVATLPFMGCHCVAV